MSRMNLQVLVLLFGSAAYFQSVAEVVSTEGDLRGVLLKTWKNPFFNGGLSGFITNPDGSVRPFQINFVMDPESNLNIQEITSFFQHLFWTSTQNQSNFAPVQEYIEDNVDSGTERHTNDEINSNGNFYSKYPSDSGFKSDFTNPPVINLENNPFFNGMVQLQEEKVPIDKKYISQNEPVFELRADFMSPPVVNFDANPFFNGKIQFPDPAVSEKSHFMNAPYTGLSKLTSLPEMNSAESSSPSHRFQPPNVSNEQQNVLPDTRSGFVETGLPLESVDIDFRNGDIFISKNRDKRSTPPKILKVESGGGPTVTDINSPKFTGYFQSTKYSTSYSNGDPKPQLTVEHVSLQLNDTDQFGMNILPLISTSAAQAVPGTVNNPQINLENRFSEDGDNAARPIPSNQGIIFPSYLPFPQLAYHPHFVNLPARFGNLDASLKPKPVGALHSESAYSTFSRLPVSLPTSDGTITVDIPDEWGLHNVIFSNIQASGGDSVGNGNSPSSTTTSDDDSVVIEAP